jgi:hypothetical protein
LQLASTELPLQEAIMSVKEERIRARAYELWEREGRSHGSHERHWLEATRQVEAEMAGEGAAAAVAPATKAPRKAAAVRAPAKRAAAPKPDGTAAAPRAARTPRPRAPKPA